MATSNYEDNADGVHLTPEPTNFILEDECEYHDPVPASERVLEWKRHVQEKRKDLQSKTVDPTDKEQVVMPDRGYYGLSDVTVTPIPGNQATFTKMDITDENWTEEGITFVTRFEPNQFVIAPTAVPIDNNTILFVVYSKGTKLYYVRKEEQIKAIFKYSSNDKDKALYSYNSDTKEAMLKAPTGYHFSTASNGSNSVTIYYAW